jgi:hypothetical protein
MRQLAIWSLVVVLGALPLAAQEAAGAGSAKGSTGTPPVKEPVSREVTVVKRVQPGDTGLQPLVEVHVGYGLIAKADDAIEFGGSTELNVFGRRYLRLVTGVDYLSTETEREISTGVVPKGSFRDVSLYSDARLEPFRVRAVAPYVGLGLGLHFRSNDYEAADDATPDVKLGTRNIADLYDGVGICAQGAAGVLVDGTETGRWGISGEVRAVRGADVDRNAVRIGLFVRL